MAALSSRWLSRPEHHSALRPESGRFYLDRGNTDCASTTPPQHVQKFGKPGSVKGARSTLEKDVIFRSRRDIVGEAGLRRALDSVGERRHTGFH
jgi:hypothetical protein